MKKFFIILIIVLIILVLGFLGWQFLLKKSAEGESCKSISDCQAGLKCVMNICSSGQIGSVCLTKTDCQSGFCVNQKCTEGKEGDPCISYNDCDGFLCIDSVCSKFSEKPDQVIFKEYFARLRLGTVKEWPKEGPPLFQETNIFKLDDQICLDATVLKDVSPEGEIYNPYEEVVVVPRMSGGPGFKKGGNIGCTSMPPELSAGKKYEYKIYIGNTLVAVLPFEVVEK